jgi:hypothetical protein
MNQEELKQRLDNCPVLDGVHDSKDQEALEATLASDGFFILWGLLLGTRQAYYAALGQAPLGKAEEVTRAARIQGQIRGVETLYNTAIDSVAPAPSADGAEQKEQR